jgi:glycosyltransferase involved in cell wall biosynthesis
MEKVSIIIPCYNEVKTIAQTLAGIRGQTYAVSSLEVIIADGLSTDRTRAEIADFSQTHPELQIRVVDNPKKTIPAGLNLAIQQAAGEYIIRMDAHSIPAVDYISRCVADLRNNLGTNVGGLWKIIPGSDSWAARSIARAAATPLGVGDAGYRVGAISGPVDTVPFGAFRREKLLALGGYDETLLSNEDYELNTRIRLSGGIVWLDADIQCAYFARSTFKALAAQYLRYGYWKAQMVKRYPKSLRWRQALPPLFVAGLLFLLLLAPFHWVFSSLLAAVILIYALILLAAGAVLAVRARELAFIIGIPVAIATMHTCWGSGFLVGCFARKAASIK